jgi:hypothetical protein
LAGLLGQVFAYVDRPWKVLAEFPLRDGSHGPFMVEDERSGTGRALVVIVPSIGVLTILERVEGSAAVAALSAIAGYILGGPPAGSKRYGAQGRVHFPASFEVASGICSHHAAPSRS